MSCANSSGVGRLLLAVRRARLPSPSVLLLPRTHCLLALSAADSFSLSLLPCPHCYIAPLEFEIRNSKPLVSKNQISLAAGDYVVEVAVAAGGRAPRPDSTALFLSTTLAVAPAAAPASKAAAAAKTASAPAAAKGAAQPSGGGGGAAQKAGAPAAGAAARG